MKLHLKFEILSAIESCHCKQDGKRSSLNFNHSRPLTFLRSKEHPFSASIQHLLILVGQWGRRSYMHPPALAMLRIPVSCFFDEPFYPFNGSLYVFTLPTELPDHVQQFIGEGSHLQLSLIGFETMALVASSPCPASS